MGYLPSSLGSNLLPLSPNSPLQITSVTCENPQLPLCSRLKHCQLLIITCPITPFSHISVTTLMTNMTNCNYDFADKSQKTNIYGRQQCLCSGQNREQEGYLEILMGAVTQIPPPLCLLLGGGSCPGSLKCFGRQIRVDNVQSAFLQSFITLVIWKNPFKAPNKCILLLRQ